MMDWHAEVTRLERFQKWALAILISGACFATWLGAQRAPDEGRAPLLLRTPVVYHATPEEYAAYEALCESENRHQRTSYLADTSSYSPTNFFQHYMAGVFASWIDVRRQAEHAEAVRNLAASAQNVPVEEIRKLQAQIKSLSTNPPALPSP